MPTTSRTTIQNSMGKAWSVIASTTFLVVVALLIFPWPNFSSFFKAIEPPRRTELPCKPPLSLLIWWDRDNAWVETDGGMKGPASSNLEYWHAGECIASRKSLHAKPADTTKPYVAWRTVMGGEVLITLGGPESEAFKREIERCERLPVVFSHQVERRDH